MNYEEIISFENLYDSYKKCKRGVTWKDSVTHYDLNAIQETLKLHNELSSGEYKARKTSRFIITSPKEREIVSVSFRDRVYQRSLNDNALYRLTTRNSIYDNCACQKGKGTDFARSRVKKYLAKFYRKYGNNGYALKLDIRHYYKSINHTIAENMIEKMASESDITKATLDVLRSQYKESKGYSPGSQMVQLVGVSFLNGLDHYIKEKLKIKYYVRYMDDLILIHNDSQYLIQCLEEIRLYLKGIDLEINDKKTRIYKLCNGFEFMGFKYRLTNSGKILMLIKTESVRRERKHLKGLARRVKENYMTREEVDACFRAWLSYIKKGNNHNVAMRMKCFYEELWR